MLRRVGELEQRLREAEATIAARGGATADPPHLQEPQAARESSQSLLEELAAANEELQIQAEEFQAQAEELAVQAKELEMQRMSWSL